MSTDPAVKKSCLDCPSYLINPNSIVSQFQKTIAAPICGRYGHVLGRPGQSGQFDPTTNSTLSRLALAEFFGDKCPSHGQSMPGRPQSYTLKVAMPDMDAREARQPGFTPTRTCVSCKNFVPEQVVASEMGWPAGLCAAKGKLILGNRQVFEARDCEFGEWGVVRSSTTGIQLLPEYTDAFSAGIDPIKGYFAPEDVVLPENYETDKPITEEDEAAGVRAWRKLLNPEGPQEVFLPIYRIDFFTEDEQAKIPRSGDDEHPELYVDHFGGAYGAAVAWQELDETPTLWGQPGTGKTEMFRYLAYLMCLPFERISITAQTEVDDLIGKMMFSPERGTYFSYGRLPKAWTKPCVVCIDEPNVGPPEVWQEIRPLTDNSKQLVVDQNEGERLPRHDDCYMGMAMNPAWDALNVGANQISDADVNRLFHISIELPPEEIERAIIQSRTRLDGYEISPDNLNLLMKVATDVRGLCEDGTLSMSWGLRPQIKVARALRWFDPVTAYNRAVGDYLEPVQREHLLDSVRSHRR